MKRDITSVLIVGAGPVGMSAALLLANHGVKSIVIEKHNSITHHPKASSFNTRTMEILRSLGIEQGIYDSTGSVGGVSFYTSLTKYRLGGFTFNSFPDYMENWLASTPAPGTVSSQIELEKWLKLKIDESDLIDFRYNSEKISLSEGGGFTTARIRDLESSETYLIEAQYTLACDGAGSPTRKELSRELIGAGSFGHQINVYIEADIESLTSDCQQALYWVSNADVSGVFIGLGGDWRKWCFNFSYFPEQGESAAQFTEERCLEKIYQALGTDKLTVKIISVGDWLLCGKVIDEYRQGRVFFGGDAAHLNIPTGGFGFNTGMQEIHNLAWKLAYVIKGIAPDELLDSYHYERRPVAVFNVETSRENARKIQQTGISLGPILEDEKIVESDDDSGQRLREKRSQAIIDQQRHFMFLGQDIGFGYWESTIISPDGSLHYVEEHEVIDSVFTYVANAKPGARAPHCWVMPQGSTCSPKSLLDYYNHKFTFLVFGNSDEWLGEIGKLNQSIPYRVFTIGSAECDLFDIEGVASQYYGVKDSGFVLVRPDGHVACRVNCSVDQYGGDSLQSIMYKSIAKQ